jgi:hypothetical protein
MWGELFALQPDERADAVVMSLLSSTWKIYQQVSPGQAVWLAGVQQGRQGQQLQPELLPHMPPISQDSLYRSCVQLVVPCFMHMRAAGTLNANLVKFCFDLLAVLLLAPSQHETCKVDRTAGGQHARCGISCHNIQPTLRFGCPRRFVACQPSGMCLCILHIAVAGLGGIYCQCSALLHYTVFQHQHLPSGQVMVLKNSAGR